MKPFHRSLKANFGVGHCEVNRALPFGVAREAMVLAVTGIPEAALVGFGAVERAGSHPLFLAWFERLQVYAQLGGERRKGKLSHILINIWHF